MGLFSRVTGRGKQKPPLPPSGRRGTGSAAPIYEEEVETFLAGEAPLVVSSSNVGALISYFPENNQLMVEYHGGRGEQRAYLYSDINRDEALSLATASSKGTWVWDHLRVRGTADQHRKPYVRLR